MDTPWVHCCSSHTTSPCCTRMIHSDPPRLPPSPSHPGWEYLLPTRRDPKIHPPGWTGVHPMNEPFKGRIERREVGFDRVDEPGKVVLDAPRSSSGKHPGPGPMGVGEGDGELRGMGECSPEACGKVWACATSNSATKGEDAHESVSRASMHVGGDACSSSCVCRSLLQETRIAPGSPPRTGTGHACQAEATGGRRFGVHVRTCSREEERGDAACEAGESRGRNCTAQDGRGAVGKGPRACKDRTCEVGEGSRVAAVPKAMDLLGCRTVQLREADWMRDREYETGGISAASTFPIRCAATVLLEQHGSGQ
eukprot:scaffold5_cov331-Pavlova_lutheri.AAC.39